MSLASEEIAVEILLFARMVELAGSSRVYLTVPKGLRIQELQQQLVSMYPALDPLASVSRWAVNAEFVDSDFAIEEPASVAVIPPVSGG